MLNDNYVPEDKRSWSSNQNGGLKADLVSVLVGKNNPLIIALLISGISFILIGVVGWQAAIELKPLVLADPKNFTILQIVGYVGIFVPIIGSFFVYKRLNTIHSWWLVTMIGVYIIAEIISFSLVFIIHNVATDWMTAFGFAGGMFVLCGVIGYFCSWIQRLWKYVAIVTVLWFVLIIAMVIVRFTLPGALKDLHLISAGVLGFLTMFYIMFDVNRMKNFLVDPNNPRGALNMILLTSFRLLIDLVNLVWVFARLTFLNK